MPMELVEEEEKVLVVVQRVEPDLVPGLAVAPALVRVVCHQPGMPLLTAMVGVRAKVLAPMGLAEKEAEWAVVKGLVRVVWHQLLPLVVLAILKPEVVVPVVAAGTVEMVVDKELELETQATTALQAVPVERVKAAVVA